LHREPQLSRQRREELEKEIEWGIKWEKNLKNQLVQI